MPVPLKITSAGNIPSVVDWSDTIQGVGYKRFYACSTYKENGSAYGYFLSSQAVDSGLGESATNGLCTVSPCDINFDFEFGVPCIVESADALVNFTLMLQDTTDTMTVTVDLYHVDTGAAETSIGTQWTDTRTDGAVDFYIRLCAKLPLTKTHFAIGEKLRLSIALTDTGDPGRIYHDGGSRMTFTETYSGATIGSDVTLDIPFKIDI